MYVSRWELRRESDGAVLVVILQTPGRPVSWMPPPEYPPIGRVRWYENGEPRTPWFSYG